MGSLVGLDLAFGLAMARMGFAGNGFCSDLPVCRHWGFPFDAQVVKYQLEQYIAQQLGSGHLTSTKNQTELRKVKKEIAALKT